MGVVGWGVLEGMEILEVWRWRRGIKEWIVEVEGWGRIGERKGERLRKEVGVKRFGVWGWVGVWRRFGIRGLVGEVRDL